MTRKSETLGAITSLHDSGCPPNSLYLMSSLVPDATLTAEMAKKEEDILRLQRLVEKHEAHIEKLTRDVLELHHLKAKERIAQFHDIADDEVSGFADFEQALAHYPPEICGTLRTVYGRAMERAYWFGYCRRRGKR